MLAPSTALPPSVSPSVPHGEALGSMSTWHRPRSEACRSSDDPKHNCAHRTLLRRKRRVAACSSARPSHAANAASLSGLFTVSSVNSASSHLIAPGSEHGAVAPLYRRSAPYSTRGRGEQHTPATRCEWCRVIRRTIACSQSQGVNRAHTESHKQASKVAAAAAAPRRKKRVERRPGLDLSRRKATPLEHTWLKFDSQAQCHDRRSVGILSPRAANGKAQTNVRRRHCALRREWLVADCYSGRPRLVLRLVPSNTLCAL